MKKLWLTDTLETKRCILRIPEESEAEYIWNLITEDTTKYMIWDKGSDFSGTLDSIKKRKKWVEEWKNWEAAIYDKETLLCIGNCWINKIDDHTPSFALGYWIAPEYYGRWIIPECVREILRFVFEESNFEKWVITCDGQNTNSWKVALKCWFEFEWKLKNHERIKGELRDTNFYGITREQYFRNKWV